MNHDINDLRKQLDEIDEQLIGLLARRFAVTENVGNYKKQHNLPAIDLSREAAQFERIRKLAQNHGLDDAFARQMLRLIIDTVVANHKRILGSK